VAWAIFYMNGAVAGLRSVSTLQIAVDEACQMLDNGADVKAIEGPNDLMGLTATDILVIHAKRQAARSN
jgi:hypothetical protein